MPDLDLSKLITRCLVKHGSITVMPNEEHGQLRFHIGWGGHDPKYGTKFSSPLSSPTLEDLFHRLDQVDPNDERDYRLPYPCDWDERRYALGLRP